MATKPKSMKAGNVDSSQSHDCCQTPPYAIDPLIEHLERWTRTHGYKPVIWEPCAGKGSIARTLMQRGYPVIATDILPIVSTLIDHEIVRPSINFFRWEPSLYDIIITNPPYSINKLIHERCAQLGKPSALLVPVETLGMGTLMGLLDSIEHEQILLDTRVDFMMPSQTTWLEGSAQFPTFWSCIGLTGRPVIRYSLKAAKKAFKRQCELELTGQRELFDLLAA